MNDKDAEMIVEKFAKMVYATLVSLLLIVFGIGGLFAYYIHKSYEVAPTGYVDAEQYNENGDNTILQGRD